MKKSHSKLRNYRVSAWVSPTYYVPLFFRERPTSFQWARARVIPLKPAVDRPESAEKLLDDAFNVSYDIPATSVDDAVGQSLAVIDFILNIASFHYSIGLAVKSPISVIDVDTGAGISYDFHQLQISREDICTKTVQMYLPMNVKGGTGTFKLSSEEILTYEPSELFKIDDFYATMDVFKSLYFGYVKQPRIRERIEFSLHMLKEAFQIPSFISRFALYWRAFEELTEPSVKSGLISKESLDSIEAILSKQTTPELTEADIKRVRGQIANIHRYSKTDLLVQELRKYFSDSDEALRLTYERLNKTRQRIIHSNYTGDDTFELWVNTDLLKSIVRQIVRVHLGYPVAGLPGSNWDKILHVREAPKPRIHLELRAL